MTAAAAAAAATASAPSAERLLLSGAVSGEDGKLLLNLDGIAGRAGHGVAVPYKLLEMLLALHAHVLVDRHRHGSLGTGSDASQTWPGAGAFV